MKYMIASDIHGSSYYCQKLMDAYKYEKPDRLILLGDILYHGPRNDLPKDYAPKKVIEMLNSISDSILCVRGNCDCEVDQMVLDFPCLADYSVLDINGLFIYCTHGHLEPVKLKMGDILLCGHTHVPTLEDPPPSPECGWSEKVCPAIHSTASLCSAIEMPFCSCQWRSGACGRTLPA